MDKGSLAAKPAGRKQTVDPLDHHDVRIALLLKAREMDWILEEAGYPSGMDNIIYALGNPGAPQETRAWLHSVVADALAKALNDIDVVGEFLSEQRVDISDAITSAARLYPAYIEWCQQVKERPVGSRAFAQALTERGAATGHRIVVDDEAPR